MGFKVSKDSKWRKVGETDYMKNKISRIRTT